ncbi:MAG: polysaccharide biosynthesis tyrosine autokinase [Verrucomicrobiae bacterium]
MASLPPEPAPVASGERAEAIRSKISRYRRVVASYWWIPAVTISIGLAAQAWISLTSPNSYQSVGRILVSGRIALPEGGMFNEEAVNFFGTQVELMQSAEVRRRAAALVQSMRPDLSPVPVSIQVSQIQRTSIFVLSASGQSPDFVKAYLNAVMEEYIALRRGIFNEKSQSTLTAITDELSHVETGLRKDEDALVEWKKKNNLSFLQEEGATAGGYLASLNRELAGLESEYNLISQLTEEQNIDRVAEGAPSGKPPDDSGGQLVPDILISSGSGTPADSYLGVKRRNYILQAQREQLLETRKEAHPKIQAIKQEMRQNKKLLEVYRVQALEQLESKRQSLSAQISNTKSQVAQWEKRSLDLSGRMGEFDRLKSKVERQKSLYDRLLANVQNVDVNSNIQQDILSIMEYATPPGVSIQPLARDLAVGVAMGAAVGIGILLIIGALDDRIVSIAELQAIVEEEVIAIIPKVPDGQQILRANEDDNQGLFESFRKLRSWLLFTEWENGPPKTILIASAMPGEGKSTVASNLAICLAASGARTLLIDADLRRGSLHRQFGLEQDPGLGDILNGSAPVDKAIHITEINNLWFIPRGYYGAGGSEIFVSASLDHFLSDIEKRFDAIIFDTSPVLAVDETSILAGKVDVALVAIRCGVTSLRLAKRATAHLLSRRAVVGGIIYNAVDPSNHEYPYYNYYYSQQPGGKKAHP